MTRGNAWPLVLFFYSTLSLAGNFATCILDLAPGASNDAVTYAVFKECGKKHPKGYGEINRGDGLSWVPFVGYTSPAACVIGHAAKTSNHKASLVITRACDCLYSKPVEADELCFYPVHSR